MKKYLILIAILIYVSLTKQPTQNEPKVESMVDVVSEPTPSPRENETEVLGGSNVDGVSPKGTLYEGYETKSDADFASWYGKEACNQREYGSTCKTASGQIFNEDAFTMACHSNYEFGTVFELCRNDRCIDVVCTDRGGFEYKYPDRLFDLSRGAFNSLDELSLGVMEVEWRIIE